MKTLSSAVAALTITLALAGSAIAADVGDKVSKEFLCQPLQGNEGKSYSLQCRVNGGIVDDAQCRCQDRFVLVNVGSTPIPAPVPSSGG